MAQPPQVVVVVVPSRLRTLRPLALHLDSGLPCSDRVAGEMSEAEQIRVATGLTESASSALGNLATLGPPGVVVGPA